MNVRTDLLFSALLLFIFVAFLHAGENEYVSIDEPNFEGVDVVVETAWGTTDKIESVDVLVLFKNQKPTGLVMARDRQKISEVTLVEGVVVKLLDHQTGKVLKKITINK